MSLKDAEEGRSEARREKAKQVCDFKAAEGGFSLSLNLPARTLGYNVHLEVPQPKLGGCALTQPAGGQRPGLVGDGGGKLPGLPLSVGAGKRLVAEGRVQRRNLVLSLLPGNPDPLIPRSTYSDPCLRACVSTWCPPQDENQCKPSSILFP